MVIFGLPDIKFSVETPKSQIRELRNFAKLTEAPLDWYHCALSLETEHNWQWLEVFHPKLNYINKMSTHVPLSESPTHPITIRLICANVFNLECALKTILKEIENLMYFNSLLQVAHKSHFQLTDDFLIKNQGKAVFTKQ